MSKTSSTASSSNLPVKGIATYLRLIKYIKPFWPAFILSVIGLAIYSFSSASFAQAMKWLIDSIEVEGGLSQQRVFFPLLVVGIFTVRGLGTFLGTYFMTYVARQLIHRLRLDLFKKFLVLPASFYDHTSSGQLVSRLTFNVEQVTGAATKAITVIIREGLFVIGLMGYLLYTNWKLSLIFVAVAPVIGLAVNFASKRFRKLSKRIQASMGNVTHTAAETLQGYKEVRIFGGAKQEVTKFTQFSEDNRKQAMKMALTQGLSTPIVQLVVSMSLGFLVWLALSPELVGQMSAGEFIAFLTAAALIAKPLRDLTEINETIQRGIAAAEEIFTYLDAPAEVDSGTQTLERAKGKLSFNQVEFSYAEHLPQVIKKISFTAQPGEMLALVGQSGSGKSTLANLILRFYDINSGSIELDDTPINELTLANLRQQLALVTQQVTLFNATLAENIAYGLDNPSREAIEAAAEAAYVTEFASKLPQGLDTLVGDNGVLLSGGQRQRVAIARAIMKDAPVLILDEATSALDTQSERYIQSALEKVMQGRTTLVIAHRLSTIEAADRILVMDNGRLIEEGSHQELLAKQGAYAQLHKLQFSEAALEQDAVIQPEAKNLEAKKTATKQAAEKEQLEFLLDEAENSPEADQTTQHEQPR